MRPSSDEVWNMLAERDPYWSVVALPENRRDRFDDAAQEVFFRGGRDMIAYVMDRVSRFPGPTVIESALDFGCGVGRLSKALVEQGLATTVVDVAPRMLELCRENLGDASHSVRFVQSDDTLSQLAADSFDLCLSSIVFQHIPPERGLAIFRRLFECVRPGGFMVHFFLFNALPKAMRVEIGEGIERDIEMNEYDLNKLMAICAQFGSECFVELMTHGSHIGMNLFARKSAAST